MTWRCSATLFINIFRQAVDFFVRSDIKNIGLFARAGCLMTNQETPVRGKEKVLAAAYGDMPQFP